MGLDTGIDTVHYVILELLSEPRWKSKIHTDIEGIGDEQLLDTVPSTQTVSRRVDELTDAGYLTTCILSPAEVDRDLIIGYKRTADGDDVMAEKRDDILQEVAHTTSNDACGQQRTVSKPALVKLIADAFDLDDTGKEQMQDRYDEEELLSLLALHYAQENADSFATHDRDHARDDENENFQRLVE